MPKSTSRRSLAGVSGGRHSPIMKNSLPIAALALVTAMPLAAQSRDPVHAPRGMVATSQLLASAAGREVLAQGGNAVDAAVAAAAVLAVVEPHMTGIGGDMFALVWSAGERRLVALRSSGRAGAGMTREAILARGHTAVPDRGPEPVTVPGALAGWDALVRRYGTRSLGELLQPAIRIADSGFAVTPIIARQWAGNVAVLRRDAGARHTFLVDGVRAPAAGEWFRNPDLAATLRQVAAEGPAALYGGSLGARVVERLGRDAESMVRDLVDAAISMVRTEREDEVYPQAETRAEERLLDILLPPPAPPPPPAPGTAWSARSPAPSSPARSRPR